MSRVLVTGASGTVGSALVPVLLEGGHELRVLSRSPEKFDEFDWSDDVETVEGNAQDGDDIRRAAEGCDAVYYLIHGLSGADEDTLVEDEVAVARTFRDAVAEAGVGRIVYLGGLVDEEVVDDLSAHMRSRYEVGRTLADGDVPTVELRASLVLAASSDSYRMLEAVATKLPAIPLTAWTRTRTQPIGVDDVTHYLAAALELPPGTYDVGGADVVTFHELVSAFRETAGLVEAPEVEVPFLPKQAASPVAALLADIDPFLARALMSSAEHDSVVSEERDILVHLEHTPATLADALERAGG